MFDQLLKSSCEDFLTNFKQAKRNWTKNPKKFYYASATIELTTMYTNYTTTGNWDMADYNAAMIISLVTALKKELNKNSPKVPKNPGAPRDGRP